MQARSKLSETVKVSSLLFFFFLFPLSFFFNHLVNEKGRRGKLPEQPSWAQRDQGSESLSDLTAIRSVGTSGVRHSGARAFFGEGTCMYVGILRR